jgi:hypothetical protein
MLTWRPKSWSEQARELCDRQIALINAEINSIEYSLAFLGNSYRHPLIRQRAAKRFGRMLREGKVRTNENN